MRRILIVESNTPELVQALKKRRLKSASALYVSALRRIAKQPLETRVVMPYAPDWRPVSLEGVDGVVFTGSSVDWSVDDARASPLQALMSAVFAAGIPCFGSCNGMQLAALLLGGRCQASPQGFELGLAKSIRLTEAGVQHPMTRHKHAVYIAPAIHRDQVRELPCEAVVLAGNDHSPVQVFVYQSQGLIFWGTQYHSEYSPHYMAGLLMRGDGIFSQHERLAKEVMQATYDASLAASFGGSCQDLRPSGRHKELAAWWRMVLQHSASRRHTALPIDQLLEDFSHEAEAPEAP